MQKDLNFKQLACSAELVCGGCLWHRYIFSCSCDNCWNNCGDNNRPGNDICNNRPGNNRCNNSWDNCRCDHNKASNCRATKASLQKIWANWNWFKRSFHANKGKSCLLVKFHKANFLHGWTEDCRSHQLHSDIRALFVGRSLCTLVFCH